MEVFGCFGLNIYLIVTIVVKHVKDITMVNV